MILLDTNIVIALLNRQPDAVFRERDARARGEDLAVSVVVTFELEYGVRRSRKRAQNASDLAFFLTRVPIIPLEQADAIAAADIRAYLDALGTPIGPYDLLIAGQALHRNATLITANTGEFQRVPGLRWQDWSQPA